MREIPPTNELEVRELAEVLASRLFSRSPKLSELLKYLCEKRFNGEADQIKEFTIAVEHFQRNADFQSRNDPIVRVDANRLRQRLRRYYRTEGKGHLLQILIPAGQYTPVFQQRAPASRAPKDIEEEPDVLEEVPAPANTPQPLPLPLPVSEPPRRNRSRTFILVAAGIVLLLFISLGLMKYRSYPRTAEDPAPTPRAERTNRPPGALPTGEEIRILAGSTAPESVDQTGNVWLADRHFTGGEVYTPLPTALLRSDDSILCRAVRVGDFRYDIPLKRGIYELHLYFAEMRYGQEPEEGGESTRRFNVFANDDIILRDFDIVSDIAGPGLLDAKVFTNIQPAEDGFLHLVFNSVSNGALLAGIEILPGLPGKMRPVRLSNRSTSYIASDQKEWESDRFARGGRITNRLHAVSGTNDSLLYQAERYGHFRYVIPVVPGKYKITLKFAETYFGQKNFGGSGIGLRVFNVHCNGQMLLENFDIAKEAGGDNRALDKVFHGIKSDPQSKIILTFVPVKNYACLNAIEIEQE